MSAASIVIVIVKSLKKFIKIISAGVLCLTLWACSGPVKDENEIKIGTISGPETQLMELAKNIALKKYHLNVNIVEFTDYNLPNQSLMDGGTDVNMFQHEPYLAAWNKSHHGNLVSIAKTFIYPMGIYSNKIDSLDKLHKKAILAIPNDPTNEARALLLLQKVGLIRLKKDAGALATIADISVNPRELKIKELDAAQLPRALPDVEAAVINSNYAVLAGLYPEVISSQQKKHNRKNAVYLENKDSLYANLFVVRADEKNGPKTAKIQQLIQAFQSPEVLSEAENIFHGGVIKGW